MRLRERADVARTETRLTADLNMLEQKIALVTGGSTGIGLAWVPKTDW
jgi:NADP-dependent 3-hydroxy acid dehydrogenase YdfG